MTKREKPFSYFLVHFVAEAYNDKYNKSVVRGAYLIESPVLGPIPPERLSGGVKTLILIAHDSEHVFNASACGNNCARWLLKIAEQKDVTVRLGYLMDFGEGEFEITVLNTGNICRNMEELDNEVIDNGQDQDSGFGAYEEGKANPSYGLFNGLDGRTAQADL